MEAERQERARGNLEVANRIIAKKRARRKEEEQLAAEAERIAKQRMFLGAAKAAIEERHFEQQMLGAERQVMKRQADAQQAAKTVEEIKHIEKNARRIRQRAAAKQKKESEVAAARSLDAARRRMYAGYVETMNEKKVRGWGACWCARVVGVGVPLLPGDVCEGRVADTHDGVVATGDSAGRENAAHGDHPHP